MAETKNCAAASNSPGVRIHPAPLHRVPPGVIHAPFPGTDAYAFYSVNFHMITV